MNTSKESFVYEILLWCCLVWWQKSKNCIFTRLCKKQTMCELHSVRLLVNCTNSCIPEADCLRKCISTLITLQLVFQHLHKLHMARSYVLIGTCTVCNLLILVMVSQPSQKINVRKIWSRDTHHFQVLLSKTFLMSSRIFHRICNGY